MAKVIGFPTDNHLLSSTPEGGSRLPVYFGCQPPSYMLQCVFRRKWAVITQKVGRLLSKKVGIDYVTGPYFPSNGNFLTRVNHRPHIPLNTLATKAAVQGDNLVD